MWDRIEDLIDAVRGYVGRGLFRLSCWIDPETARWVRQHDDCGQVMYDWLHGKIDAKEAANRGYAAFY